MNDETKVPPGLSGTATASIGEGDDAVAVFIRFRTTLAGVEVLDVRAWTPGGGAITPAVMRQVGANVQAWAETSAADTWTRHTLRLGDGTLTLGEGDDAVTYRVSNATVRRSGTQDDAAAAASDLASRRKRGRLNDEQLLRTAAEAYMTGGRRLKPVMDVLHVEKAQASRYVKAAKDAGFIPTEGGDRG